MPILPPAPPMFSMKNCMPSRSESFCTRMRPTISVAPPGGNGTMTLTA